MTKRSCGIWPVAMRQYKGAGKWTVITATVELFVDTDKVVNTLAHKVLRSKGGKSLLCDGAIEVKLVKSTRNESEVS